MPKFSNKSIATLITCSQNIQDVMRVAIMNGPDFAVLSGRRTRAEQAEKVRLGYSKTMDSKHVADPPWLSKAVDIGPWIPEYKEVIIGTVDQIDRLARVTGKTTKEIQLRIWKQYGLVAGYILRVAEDMQVPLIWGGDWDRDWNTLENGFEDLGHFEEVA